MKGVGEEGKGIEAGKRARRWFVSGRVQGVGFRWFAQNRAEELGLIGWARNLADGRVEVVAKGPPTALRDMEHALATGPRWARVDNVEKADIPHEEVHVKSFKTM